MSLFTITLVLLFIMDPIGNVASFLNVLSPYDSKKRRFIVVREMLIALAVMLFFNFFGDIFFRFLEISETTVCLASGVILFLIALTIIFPGSTTIRGKLPQVEPFIIPLAIPLISGPALIATIMLYAHMESSYLVMLQAIGIAWFISLLILLCASQMKRIFGSSGLIAGERLMGMILILIAVQRFMDGVTSFIDKYHG